FSDPANAEPMFRGLLGEAVAAQIDWSSLTLRPGTFIDEDLAKRESDILFSAELAGRPALLYLLFEHQSSGDRWMPLRLLRYAMRIWDGALRERPERLPVVIPCVLHHSERGWRDAIQLEELFGQDAALLEPATARVDDYVPRWRVALYDVSHVSDDELRTRFQSAYVRMVLASLRDARRLPRSGTDREALTTWLERFRDWLEPLLADAYSRQRTYVVMRYLFQVIDGRAVFYETVRHVMGTESEQKFRSLWDEAIDEGLAKGRVEGRAEGTLLGRRSTLAKLVQLRFGPLTPATEARIDAADEATLDRWTERILTAADLDELFA
ncbi:MAG: Rpn family recombination-promoting nuclease/putative transposase, partial [Myxococcales bacterium]|nr:Rpn family recombination-promoting nuclease/putative transposase [Myxococcales bacterium]